jgi:hypothetical protein
LLDGFARKPPSSPALSAAFSARGSSQRERIQTHLEEVLYRAVVLPEIEVARTQGFPPGEDLVLLWEQLKIFLKVLTPYLVRTARAHPPEEVLAWTLLFGELPLRRFLDLGPDLGSVELRGRADGLWFDHQQERPVLVEFKTRPLSGGGEDFLQLALYQGMLREENGVEAAGRLLPLAGGATGEPLRGPSELRQIEAGCGLREHLSAMLGWISWSPGSSTGLPGPALAETCQGCPVRAECRRRLGAPSPGLPPAVSIREEKPLGVRLGKVAGEWVEWAPNDTEVFLNPNLAILGTMGTGKTQCTRSILHQLIRAPGNVGGRPPRFLVFDYKGDYSKPEFADAVGAQVLAPYHLPLNPLAMLLSRDPERPSHQPVWNTAQTFADSLTRAWNLGAVQRSVLCDLVVAAYQKRGILDAEAVTWGRPPPCIHDVVELFLSGEKVKKDRLYGVLRELQHSQLFAPDPAPSEASGVSLWERLQGVTVVDLQGGISESLQNLAVACLLDRLFAEMQVRGESALGGPGKTLRELRLFLLVDEADQFMQGEFPILRRLLKEGRSYGLGVILSTQYLRHFSTRKEQYFESFSSWVVHRFTGLKTSQLREVFGLTGKAEQEAFRRLLRRSKKHQSLVRRTPSEDFQAMEDFPHFRLLEELDSLER